MTPRAAADRYARALLDVTREAADPQRAGREIAAFADLLASHADLAKAMVNPAIPAARKRAVVAAIVDRADGLTPAVARLLLLLAERDRLALLPAIVSAYAARLMDHLQVVQAAVRTAAPLPPDRLDALARRLSEATGREVRVAADVDPSIIGGVVARVGSVVYDGSVVRQLERLKERLVEGA